MKIYLFVFFLSISSSLGSYQKAETNMTNETSSDYSLMIYTCNFDGNCDISSNIKVTLNLSLFAEIPKYSNFSGFFNVSLQKNYSNTFVLVFSVVKRIIEGPLCYNGSSKSVCFTCIDNARLSNGFSNCKIHNSSLDFIHSMLKVYFSDKFLSSPTIDLYLDSVRNVLENSNLNTATLKDSVDTTVFTLNRYNSVLTDTQATNILSIYSPHLKSISHNRISALLDTTRQYWSLNILPKTKLEYSDSNLYFLLYRAQLSDLASLQILNGLGNLKFPNTFPINSSYIIDAYYSNYQGAYSNIANFKLLQSGTYQNYSLNLQNPLELNLFLTSPVIVTLNHNLSSIKNIECITYSQINWSGPFCTVVFASSTRATVNLYHNSHIKLQNVDRGVDFEVICMFIVFGFFAIGALIVITFIFKDSEIDNNLSVKKSFVMLYPVTSLMIKQDKPWRLLMATQLLTSELVLLASSGTFFRYPQSETTLSLTVATKGVICLVPEQAFTICCMLINFASLGSRKIHYFSFGFCLVLSACSIFVIIFMMLQDDGYFIGIWLSYFTVYMYFDLFVLQVIYTLAMSKRKQIREPKFPVSVDKKLKISKGFDVKEKKLASSESINELAKTEKKKIAVVYDDNEEFSEIRKASQKVRKHFNARKIQKE